MSNPCIKKNISAADAVSAALAEAGRVLEATQHRALKLFHERGDLDGDALIEWLTAKNGMCASAAEIVQRNADFMLRIALPGADLKLIEAWTPPREVPIRFKGTSDTRALPMDLRSDQTKAWLNNGVLTIIAPKVDC